MNCHQRLENLCIQPHAVDVAWYDCQEAAGPIFSLAWIKLPLPGTKSTVLNGLSSREQKIAEQLTDETERQHFIGRRVLQNWFVAKLAGREPFGTDNLVERTAEGAPFSPHLPGWSLSFSTTPDYALAAASSTAEIGIDIEQLRPIAEAVELAHRFFAPAEASAIESAAPAERSEMFLRYWSAKEACTKLLGQGMVFGPERFVMRLVDSTVCLAAVPEESGKISRWSLNSLNLIPNLLVSIACRNNQ